MPKPALIAALLLALAATVPAGPPVAAAAAPTAPAAVSSRFYDFGEQLMKASTRGPALALVSGRRAARFGRLMRLKKDLLSRVAETRAARAFK